MNSIVMTVCNGIWRVEHTNGQGMDNIGMFLASDVSWDGAPYFRIWILEDGVQSIAGNFSLLLKKRHILLVTCHYAQDIYTIGFKVSAQVLADLLLQWEVMCTADKDSALTGALIAYDGAKFYLEPQLDSQSTQMQSKFSLD